MIRSNFIAFIIPSQQQVRYNQLVKGQQILLLLLGFIPIIIIGLGIYLFSNYKTIQRNIVENKVGKTSEEIRREINPIIPTPTIAITQESVAIVWNNTAQEEREEILQKVIRPYIDYYQDETHISHSGRVGLYTVIINASDNVAIPYVLTAEFKNGRNEMIGIKKTDGRIVWWVPECVRNCIFSSNFSKKYPEIVKRFTPVLNRGAF